jgi:hypothetical protein
MYRILGSGFTNINDSTISSFGAIYYNEYDDEFYSIDAKVDSSILVNLNTIDHNIVLDLAMKSSYKEIKHISVYDIQSNFFLTSEDISIISRKKRMNNIQTLLS